MLAIKLSILAVIYFTGVYLSNLIFNKRVPKIKFSRAFYYVSLVAMVGVLAEIIVDTVYVHLSSEPLWHYNYLPIYHGYTSQFSPVLWGALGFYLYLFHPSYDEKIQKKLLVLALIFSIEAPIIEGIADFISKFILGKYIYFYHPSGLWHVTSFQGIPFYFLTGLVIISSISIFKYSPRFFTVLSFMISASIILLVR